ncbi:MAG: hypothetical protein CVV52_10390 [Spirochaetae bacterium HGW-Spirochaetae-8]|nr:MAG: hypothetical protein CVV52_10390 [Spirochaetae bacterium HGW-Spirochaetae-8]
MRKLMLLLLLIPLLLFTIVSCEGDILSTISGFMGATQDNVLIENGLVTVDTSAVDTVATTVTTIIVNSGDTAPTETELDGLQDDLADILNSEQKAAALIEEMAKPATEVPPETIARLEEFLPQDDEGNVLPDLTQGDLLVAELIAGIMNDPVAQALLADPNDPAITDEQKDKLLSDALQAIEVIKQISDVGTVSIDSIVSDLLNDFLSRSVGSRDFVGPTPAEMNEYWGYAEPVLLGILDAAGTTAVGDVETIDPAGLATLISNYRNIRSAYQTSVLAMTPQTVFELSDLIDYALSVVFTEASVFAGDEPDLSLELAINQLIPYIGVTFDETTQPPAFIALHNWETLLGLYTGNPASQGFKDKFTTVASTMLGISRAVANNTQITGQLELGIVETNTGLTLGLDVAALFGIGE